MNSILIRKLIIIVLFAATIQIVQAEVGAARQEPGTSSVSYSSPLALGLGGGLTSGIGFSVRKHFENRWGMHLAAFPLGGNSESGAWFWGSFGGQVMYTLHRHPQEYFRLYLLAGGQVITNGDKYNNEIFNPVSMEYERDQNAAWSWDAVRYVGGGLGFEFLIMKHVAFTIEVPVTTRITDNGYFRIIPGGNGALMYFF